jgi:hypothetical protein
MPPLTKLWYMKLKESTSTDSTDFKEVWAKGLDFCSEMSGPEFAGHTLWQDEQILRYIVFISGYPSQESADASDAAAIKANMSKDILSLAEHKAIFQLAWDVSFDLPIWYLKAKFLAIQVFTTKEKGGSSEEDLEKDVREENELLVKEKSCHYCVSGWDIFPDVVTQKKGLPPEKGAERKFIRVTAWDNKNLCGIHLDFTSRKGRKPTLFLILRQLMGQDFQF